MRVEGDVDVAQGIEMVLRSRLFHSEECRARRVKSPVDFAVGAIRSCELFAPPPDFVDLEIHLTKMGQRLFFPPSVAGWPGGLAWLDGQARGGAGQFRGLDHRAVVTWRTMLVDSPSDHGLKTPEDWLDAHGNVVARIAALTGGPIALRASIPESPANHAAVAFTSRGPGWMNRRNHMISRRDLLIRSAGLGLGTGLLSLGSPVPGLWRQAAEAAEPRADLPILVVIELTGGNDGLNTVVPHADDIYHKSRPTPANRAGQGLEARRPRGPAPCPQGVALALGVGRPGR